MGSSMPGQEWIQLARLFYGPVQLSLWAAVAVRRKETAAMLPEQRPEAFLVCPRKAQTGQVAPRMETESAFAMGCRHLAEPPLDFEQEHEPVGLSLVSVFADQTGQVQVGWLEAQADFLLGFATGAGIRGFAGFGFQLAAARAPQATVGFLSALEQQHSVSVVEAVEQGGDAVGQRLHTGGI